MAPWYVGGKYERPIARRCAVEAGVPSEWFGTRKYGSGWGLIKNISELSASSQEDFRAYLASVENPSGPVHSRFSWQLVQVYMGLLRLFKMNTKKMKYIPRSMKRFTRPPLEDQLFRWGITRTMGRYDAAFTSDCPHAGHLRFPCQRALCSAPARNRQEICLIHVLSGGA